MEDGKFQICDINEKKLGLKKVVNINIIYLSNQRLAIDLTMSCEGKQNLENVTFKNIWDLSSNTVKSYCLELENAEKLKSHGGGFTGNV